MYEAIEMYLQELIDIKRSDLVRRTKQAKRNVRKTRCRCGMVQDLLMDLSKEGK